MTQPVELTARGESPVDGAPPGAREYRALGVLAVMATLVVLGLAIPIGSGVFLGALVAFSMYPLHASLRRKTGSGPLAALICAAIAWLGFFLGVGGLLYLLVRRGVALAHDLPAALAPGGPIDRTAGDVSDKLSTVGVRSDALDHRLHHAAEEVASYAAGLAGSAMSGTFRVLLAFFFMVITVYSVLSQWGRLAHWAEALMPLRPIQTRRLIEALRLVGREIMLGTVVVGLVQGVLAGGAYAVLGVPQAAFFGAMTAVASTIPFVGTMLVWAPIGVYLVTTGHVVAGILELVWGAFIVVTLSDGILRPLVVGRGSRMGLLPALIGLFGGIELFGFVGLLIGPTLVGVALAVFRLYAAERADWHRRLRRREHGEIEVDSSDSLVFEETEDSDHAHRFAG
jgi:predicted PurR-regulated permease PerM